MDILLVAATPAEAKTLSQQLRFQHLSSELSQTRYEGHKLSLLCTGIGMVSTAYCLGRYLATHRTDLSINFGIAGSFDRSLALGQVVEIVEDSFPELGAESPSGELNLEEMGFSQFEKDGRIFFNTFQNPQPSDWQLPKVTALTVNRVHGLASSIAKVAQQWPAQIESMEGAAFFHAMIRSQTPFYAIRGISNYVEARDRSRWNIPLAVENVQSFLLEKLANL